MCFTLLSIVVINIMIKHNLRRKGLISFYNSQVTLHHPLLIEVKVKTYSMNLVAGAEALKAGGTLLMGLHSASCSVAFLFPPRSSATHSWLGPPAIGRQSRNWPTDLPTGLSYEGTLSTVVPFSYMILVCFKRE